MTTTSAAPADLLPFLSDPTNNPAADPAPESGEGFSAFLTRWSAPAPAPGDAPTFLPATPPTPENFHALLPSAPDPAIVELPQNPHPPRQNPLPPPSKPPRTKPPPRPIFNSSNPTRSPKSSRAKPRSHRTNRPSIIPKARTRTAAMTDQSLAFSPRGSSAERAAERGIFGKPSRLFPLLSSCRRSQATRRRHREQNTPPQRVMPRPLSRNSHPPKQFSPAISHSSKTAPPH